MIINGKWLVVMSTLLLSIFFLASDGAYAEEEYWASKNTTRYHYPTCRLARKIRKKNLVIFKSVDEAEEAGYFPCKICKPSNTEVKRERDSRKKKSGIGLKNENDVEVEEWKKVYGWENLPKHAKECDAFNLNILLERGVDPNVCDDKGVTALMWAATEGCFEIVEVLILENTEIDRRDHNGLTALMWAAKGHGTTHGQAKTIEYLLRRNAELDARDDNGCTALIWAAREANGVTLRILLEENADVDATDNEGKTALIWAAGRPYSRKFLVEDLLEAGVDMDIRDKSGMTALDYAAAKGHTEIIRLLKEAGAEE
jgi:ankyrin repeat protein